MVGNELYVSRILFLFVTKKIFQKKKKSKVKNQIYKLLLFRNNHTQKKREINFNN